MQFLIKAALLHADVNKMSVLYTMQDMKLYMSVEEMIPVRSPQMCCCPSGVLLLIFLFSTWSSRID